MKQEILVYGIDITSVKPAVFNFAGLPVELVSTAYSTSFPRPGNGRPLTNRRAEGLGAGEPLMPDSEKTARYGALYRELYGRVKPVFDGLAELRRQED